MSEKKVTQGQPSTPGMMEAAMKETLGNFQTQLNGMLTQVKTTMENYKQSALQNGEKLKVDYTKGIADLQVQMKKATDDMATAYTKNYDEFKASLKKNYDDLYGQAKTNIDKVLEQFKTNIPQLILSLPGPQKKFIEDLTKTMEDTTTRTLGALTTSYNEMIAVLDKGYQEGLKALQAASSSISKNMTPAPSVAAAATSKSGKK